MLKVQLLVCRGSNSHSNSCQIPSFIRRNCKTKIVGINNHKTIAAKRSIHL